MKQEKQKQTTRNVLKKFGVGAMLTATMFCTGGLLSGCMADGKDGKDGANAAAWYYGTATPTLDNRPGQVGDYYIDQDDNKIYQLTTEGWVEVANFGSGAQGPAGQPGADGEDGVTPHIGANGNWYIGTQDTGIKAQGQNGADGQPGENGQDGVTPHIGANGNWYIGTQDTGIKAQGQNGANGQDGTSILTGLTEPDSADGKNGDVYLNETNFDLYKKQDNTWVKIGNIKGASAEENREYWTNIYDKTSTEHETGGMLSTTGGFTAVGTGDRYQITPLIPVERQTYLFNTPGGESFSDKNYNYVYLYDADGNFVEARKGTMVDDGGTPIEYDESNKVINSKVLNDDVFSFTISNPNVKYVKFNLVNTVKDSFMVIPGTDWPKDYVGFNDIVYKEQKIQLTDKQYEMLLKQNPLYAKRIAFEGDSICHGASGTTNYATLVSKDNSMTLTNNAVSGGTITDGVYSESGVAKHSIVKGVETLVNNKDNYDYIIFEGGVNDTSLDIRNKAEGSERADNTYVKFGTITEGYTADLDITTFCGAFEYCCKSLTNSGKKVGYIFVHKIFPDSHYWVTEYRPAMIKILNKWGIPYLDLETEVPPLNMIPGLRDTYTVESSKNPGHGDGWHPNTLGYETYYQNRINEWLKTL